MVSKPGEKTNVPNDQNFIWNYPPLSLLSDKAGGEVDRGDVKKNAEVIERTLSSFGIKTRVVEVNYGPTVTQYVLEVAAGTKLSKITSLAAELALALATTTGQVLIEAPIAGRSLVWVEVPNRSIQLIPLRIMLASDKLRKNPSKLAIPLGVNITGQEVVVDVAKMPHVLIAGTTGSGKSVAINTLICAILFRASPAEVKFILINPRIVDLAAYRDIPHLLTPVITQPRTAVTALRWAVAEMNRRYKQLAEVGAKNTESYNDLAGFQVLPDIVIVIDEMSDLMRQFPFETESLITELSGKASPTGIHLILATQRPSVDIITGLIKANIPTRIAFRVSSSIDSSVILDKAGAEKLLNPGDMLFLPPDKAEPMYVHGTFVSDVEIEKLVGFLKVEGQVSQYEEATTTNYQSNTIKNSTNATNPNDLDPLFAEAVKLFSQYDKASSSLIQRRLSVGYARASCILDQLYAAGFVGPADGSQPRDVNLSKVREYLKV